jgi:hypothetical protein
VLRFLFLDFSRVRTDYLHKTQNTGKRHCPNDRIIESSTSESEKVGKTMKNKMNYLNN